MLIRSSVTKVFPIKITKLAKFLALLFDEYSCQDFGYLQRVIFFRMFEKPLFSISTIFPHNAQNLLIEVK